MAISPIIRGFKGAGQVFVDVFGDDLQPTGVYRQFGNTTQLDLKPNSESESRESMYAETYGNELESLTLQKAMEVKFTVNDVPRHVLKLALFGADADLTQAAAAVDQTFDTTIVAGGIVALPHVNILEANFAISADVGGALALGTDFEVDYAAGLVKFLEGTEKTGDAVVTYRHGAITDGFKIQAGVKAQIKCALRLSGKNMATGEKCILDIWAMTMAPDSEIKFMDKAYQSVAFSGKVNILPGKSEPVLLRSF